MPTFEAPHQPSLIADAITAYLEQVEKPLHPDVLEELLGATKRMITRQLMSSRKAQPRDTCTSYTHPCARKAWHLAHGTPRGPMQARALLKFLIGDEVELLVLGIARLAGLDIGLNNEDLTIQADDLSLVPVHPDGLLHVEGRHYNVEVKSCDSKTFDRWLEQGGPDETWGYKTQASIEVAAWREHTWDVNETVFVAISTGSRIGSIAEWILPYQPELVEGWQARRSTAKQAERPAVPYAAVAELDFQRGKACKADWFVHGEPTARENEKGIYGWDVPTGRLIVPGVPCGYCDFLSDCFPSAQMDVEGGKPIWVIPSIKGKHVASAEEFAAHLRGDVVAE